MPLAPGYWYCFSDAAGRRLYGAEVQLTPGPGRVELPFEALGTIQETADGNAIMQRPTKDSRTRTWAWKNYQGWMPAYQRLWQTLQTFHSARRFQAGLSPFVYLLDNATGKGQKITSITYTVGSGAPNTVTTGSTLTSDDVIGGSVEVTSGPGTGQTGFITDRSGNDITVSPAWTVEPTASTKIIVRYQTSAWFRVRVLHVDRRLAEDRAQQYDETKIMYVVDDASWNDN